MVNKKDIQVSSNILFFELYKEVLLDILKRLNMEKRYFKFVVQLTVLFTLVVTSAGFAQPQFTKIQSDGEPYTINKNEGTYYALWGVDSDSIAYIRARDDIGRYDLKTNTWLAEISSDSLSGHYQYARYDSARRKFVAYSNGGGRVALVDKNFSNIERIDNSFLHENQHNASATYNERIYLFGGYGFWESTNITTFYHPEIHEWSIASYKPDQQLPEPRQQSWSFWDSSGENLYVLGGKGISGNRDDSYAKPIFYNDIWRFDLDSGDWKLLDRFSLTNPFANTNGGSFYDTYGCDRHNVTYGFTFKKAGQNTIYAMFSFDEASEELYFSNPLTDNFIGAEFIGMWIDQQEHTLHFFVKQINDRSEEDEVAHYTLDLNTTEQLENAGMNQPASVLTLDLTQEAVLGLMVVLMIAGAFWTGRMHMQKTGQARSHEVGKEESKEEITISEEDLPVKDLRVLLFLTKKYEEDAWVSASEIEEFAFPDEKNLDYARNLRNLAFTRIQKKLSAKSNLSDEEIILSRKSEADKRKLEYKLNLSVRLK